MARIFKEANVAKSFGKAYVFSRCDFFSPTSVQDGSGGP